MSQTKLPQDPEGGQHCPTCSPQPQLSMERTGGSGAGVPQERIGPRVLVSGSATQGLLLGALLCIKVYRNPC